jgi:hypothetical protein
LKLYPTAAKLTEPEAQVSIVALALLIVLNIAFIERGHAQNRRTITTVGDQGRSVPLSVVAATQSFRHAHNESEWLGDRAPVQGPGEDDIIPLPQVPNMRGPHLWNQFQMENSLGEELDLASAAQRRKDLKSSFDALEGEELAGLQQRCQSRLDRKRAGDPLCTKEESRKQSNLRSNQRRTERHRASQHNEAGPALRQEIRSVYRDTANLFAERKAQEKARKEEIRQTKSDPEIIEEACDLCEDLLDVREHLTPLVGGPQRPDGTPMVLWYSTVPKESGGVRGSPVPLEYWEKLRDGITLSDLSQRAVNRHFLVMTKDCRNLFKFPRIPYCFRAGFCVCQGENIKYLLLYKELRRQWTRHITTKNEKLATEVVEITGPVENQAPDAGERLFFHVSARVGEVRALLRMRLRLELPDRLRLRGSILLGVPQYCDWWILVQYLLDTFGDSSFYLQFYKTVSDGRARDPWDLREIDVQRRELVGLYGYSFWRAPLWRGWTQEHLRMPRTARAKAKPAAKAGAQAGPKAVPKRGPRAKSSASANPKARAADPVTPPALHRRAPDVGMDEEENDPSDGGEQEGEEVEEEIQKP